MRSIALSPLAKAELLKEYSQSPHSKKQVLLEDWAQRIGCSKGGLRNAIYNNFSHKSRKVEFAPEKKAVLEIAASFVESAMCSRASTKVALSHVVKVLEASDRIPKGVIKSRELSLFMRTYRIGSAHKVTKRFRRNVPNALHHIDFSVSRVVRFAGSEMVQIRSDYTYENRPNDDRLRVWIGSVVDDASGLMFVKYYLSRGESTTLALKFLRDAWQPKSDYPFYGVPDAKYTDRAGWARTDEAVHLFDALGVENILASTPQAKGKVERKFRPIKEQFENLVIGRLARGSTLSLQKLNELALTFCKEQALKPHPRAETKLEYWRNYVPVLRFPDNFDELAYRKHEGMVRRGYITFEGKDYFAPAQTPDGTRVELLKLYGKLYIYMPGSRLSPARRLLLEEALLNSPVPVDFESERIRKSVSGKAKTLKPFSLSEAERILTNEIDPKIDWTPPPRTTSRRPQSPGIELLHENAQRDLLAKAVGPLGDLPDDIKTEFINPFCAQPHTRADVDIQAGRIMDALGNKPQIDIEELLRSTHESE